MELEDIILNIAGKVILERFPKVQNWLNSQIKESDRICNEFYRKSEKYYQSSKNLSDEELKEKIRKLRGEGKGETDPELMGLVYALRERRER